MFYVYMWFLVFLYGNCIDFFNKNFKIFFLFLKSFIEIYFTKHKILPFKVDNSEVYICRSRMDESECPDMA